MPINKVTYNNTTLIDLSSDTVAADKLLTGYTAHDNTGNIIIGNLASGSPSIGSLIVCNCSSNITDVKARYGSDTVGSYIASNIAYMIIPYTYTGTVYIDGYVGTSVLTTEIMTVSGINKYTVELSTSGTIYDSGTWTGVGEHSWNYSNYNTAPTEGSSSIYFPTYISENENYLYGYGMNIAISTRGFSKLRFHYTSIESDSSNMSFGYATSWAVGYGKYPSCSGGTFRGFRNKVLYSSFDTTNQTATVNILSGDTNIYLCILCKATIDKIEFV